MANNNLGFEYTLNVNERATRQNLNTFIRNTFGEGKNAKLSVPIKLDISNSIRDIDFKRIQKDIDDNVGNNLKVKAKIVIDTNNIKNQLTSKIGEIEKDLKFKVGLEIDSSAINLISGTVDVMKTLNAEIDKVKDNMKELGKNLTINIGDVHLGKQYDEILETSKEIKEENKETEASLEEQLDIQKRILQEKRNQLKQTEKDIKAEKDRLDLAKQRKANNDKLIEQEKEIRKQASDINEQIKAEKDKQKTYEKQNDALKKQSNEQKKLADDLKKTNEEIKKLENDKTAAQQRVNLAKEEEQRRANNLEIMRKENDALKEKLANLQKIAKTTNDATTVDKTTKTTKGTSIKQQANDAIKQVTNVSEKRIEQEKQVTNEIEKQSEAQIKAINKVTEAENKAEKAKVKSDKKATSSTSSTKKSKGKRRNLYDDVQSAEIAKAIHDETVEGVRSLEEEKAEMRRLGDMVANERGLLQQVTECLERNKELTRENADEVQNLLTKLADEKTLIQEAAGNRDYVNYADFKNALKKYQQDPSDKNLEKLEYQMEKWGKIGAMYEYRKDVQEAINALQKQYNIEAQRSLEIDKKQNQINEARTSRATNMQSKAAENKIGFDVKKLKYRDAGSFVKEEMYGFSAEELAKAIEKYDDALQPFMDASGFHIDYGKTDDYIADIKDKVEKLATAMNNATDTQKIEAYNAKIEKLNRNIKVLQKTVNTYEHIDALMKMKEGVTFDLGAEDKDNKDINKVLNLKEIVSEFAQYSKGVNLAREQTSQMRQDLSWLAKDFDKLIAEKSMDEEKWQSLADKTQQYKKELGVTEDQIKQFINTKNEEIEQGNEHLAKLKELQKTYKRGTNEYRECSKVIKDYNNALENDLPITSTIKDMKELINILDRGKDSFDNFGENGNNENTVKIIKKQKASIEELAKQMESQDIMAEKIYLANKKNEQAMIDINQVVDRQRKTWKDLTGEVEKYYSKLSSEEVDKGLSIIRAEDKSEKNPNYRISNYMTKSLDKENLSLKEKISLLAEYEAKSKVIETLKRKVNQVEKDGLSYLEDEEDEIQRLNQKKQEQINKTINHTKATQNNNKALKEQADVSKNIAKIDVSQQNKNMQELFRSVALGDNNLENLSELLKLVKNEVEKFSLVLSSGTGLTDEARKSMYALKESFTKAEQALTTMEQKTGNANFTIEKGSKGFNTQKDILAKLYKEIYNVSESTQQSNQVEEKANQIAEDKAKNTNKVVGAIKQETNAIDDKTMALKSMALQAGIAEEKLDDLLMRIGNVIGSGKRLSKTEMGKLAKDFPTEDLASASERRANLISEGRKGKYNQTDEYKQRKGQLDALVANYTDNAFDLFQKIYEEAKRLDKLTEQTNRKITRTSKPKKQEVTQQEEITKAVEGTTQAIQEQNETSTKVQDNHHAQMRQAIQDIYNITDAQERFNKMLELTGLNYDELYKKYLNEMKNSTFEQMGIKNDRIQMDKVYTGNISLSQKEAVLDRATYLSEEPGQLTKSNMNLWKKYYAEADVISQVMASMTKIIDDYNYEAKTAEQLIYQITEKGLNDQLAIEVALKKVEEERLGLLESIGKAEERLAEEKATRKVGTSEEIKALEEELKVLKNNPLYQRYNKAMEAEAKESLKLANLEVTPNNLIQSRFKIEGNLDMDMAYEEAINDFRRTTETLKRFNIKPEEVQAFVALYSKIKEVNGKISDIEYSMQDSHEERILENLRKRLAELDASSKELTSILPKQQEQVQVQQQQAEAVLETAQATEKLAKAQEKIKTNLIDSDSLNGGNIVNKEHYLPDAAIALMEAQMGTYLKNGKVTASFKDYDYEGYNDPRDKMAKEYIVYHERFEELNDVLKRMVEMAIAEDDVLNKKDFQALRKQYDRLMNIMEVDIRNIINGLESQGAEPFIKGDFANFDELLKQSPKARWFLSPDDLAQNIADNDRGVHDDNVKTLKEWIQANKERIEYEKNNDGIIEAIRRTHEMTAEREKAKLSEAEYREELLKTREVEASVAETCENLCRQIIKIVDAQGKIVEDKEAYDFYDSFKQDALYGFDNVSNGDLAWIYLAEGMIKSAKDLGVAVDEQEAIYQKEIDLLQKQEDVGVKKVDNEYIITEQKEEQVKQEEKVAETISESVENYKQAYEEVMRLIEASKEYSKLSDDSSEKIDFQDLRDRAETIDDDDVSQWREMYQLSLALGDEMELNINRERQLAKEKQATLDKTKALLSDGRTTEQYWKDEKEAIEKESSAIEENINAKKEETNATEQLTQAQNEASNKTEEVAKSKDKVTKASRQAKKALDEEKEALIASTNVKDHIEATMKALDKVNKSATFKKKAKENSTLQDMFNELKREANINKSSGILGIDYWDGLIDRIKIFATEMVKMKAKTIDDAVNSLIYTNATSSTSGKAKASNASNKSVVDVKTKSVEVQKQETDAIKETTQVAKEYQQVLENINIDTLKDNLGRTWQQIAEEERKALSKMKEDLLFFELNNMEMDGIYSDKNDASEKRYKAANYMDTTNFTAKNKKEAIDLLSEYYAKTLILHQLQQKEEAILASQVSNEDKIKVLEEERTSLLQRRKIYSEEELEALKKSKDNADEYYKSVKEASTEFAKLEEHAKSLNIKKEAIPQHIDGLIMQGMYYEQLGQSYKPLKEIGVDQTKLIQENEKSRTALSLRDSATNAYEKALESNKENAKIDARIAEIDKEIAQLKGEQTEEVKQQANIVEQQKEDIQEQAVVIEQQTEDVKEQTNAIQEQAKVEEQKQVIDEKSKQIKQDKVEVENEEVKALQEQIAKNEELIKQEEEAMQDAKETATMHEMEVATINYKIKQAKELRDEQEKQLANANENSEKMKEEYRLQDEGIKRITEKIKALEEEKRVKEQMADDLKQQILQEEALGNVSDDVLNSMIDDYNNLRKEAENTKKSIDLITTAIKNQKDYEEMSKTGVNPLQPINNSPQSAPNWTTGGRGGSNGGNGDDGSINEGNTYNEILSERIKLKQRALMLDIENLVYGKDLTDSQKLMVNELVEQVVQLGKSVSSMKELSLEAQKIKQNINETKFDVKVSTTEDKNAKKLLEQKRKETTEMYKGLFDQAIAQEEAKLNAEREKRNELTRMYTRLMNEAIAKEDARAKYVKEQTAMYTKLWEQQEKGVQAEERAKVVLEDKIAKQRDLWQLKVKEFSQSDNSNYARPEDIANMKQMADNIGNNVTNMRELNQQLHEMNMAYKEISSSSKNTKAMFNDAEKAREEAEANKQAQQALKELIATKEEDLRQTHQNITNGKAYREATDGQRQTFDAFKEQLKLTGSTTEEVNNQYKTLVQTMNGMKIDMTTDALRRQNTMFGKLKETVKQYITLNFDVMDMLNYAQRGFQNAFEHIRALDEAYTNINMTMGITDKQFETMKQTAMEVGNANGQLETEVLNMMKVYSNAGTSVEEVNKQMKASVAFQNVSDLDASSVTQSIQTIIQQYKLLENGTMDSAKATEYLGDVMVAVAYNLAKEESVAMQEVISGIETAGNMIKTSGGSFEWFTSVIGTLSEVMNASGSETANAMKMIAARTLKSKEAIEDLTDSGEDMEDIEIAASNAEKALNSIGLSARDSNNDFKDLEVILGEVAGKWDTLSDATKQYVSEQLAGNNRRSFFIGLMENYDRTMELQQLAEDSSGKLMEASEKKAQSLEGRLNQLQNAWYNLYETMLNSALVKGGVSTLTKVINAISESLNKLLIILPAVVVAWKTFTLALKGYTIFDGIELGIMGAKDALLKLTANLGLTTTAASGATVAMSALQAVCAGLVVGGVAVGIGFLINKLKETKEQMEGVGDNLQELKDNLSQIDGVRDLVESYKNANLELTILQEGTDEYIEKQNEIKAIKEQLMQYSSEYKTLLDSETASVEEQCEAMLNLLDYKARQNVEESLDNLPDQRRANNKVTEFHEDTGKLEELSKDYEKAKKEYDKALVAYANATPEQAEALYKALQDAEKDMTNAKNKFESKRAEALDDLSFIKNWNDTLETAKEMGVYTELQTLLYSEDLEKALMTWMAMDDEATNVGEKTEEAGQQAISLSQTVSDAFKTMTTEEGDMTKAVEVISKTFRNGTFEVEDMADALEILKSKFPELLKNAEDFGQAISILDTKSANESYIEQLNTIEDIKATLEQITEEGFTLEIATELMDSGWLDDYTGRIDDASAVQEHLNNKIAEAQEIANTAYYNMMKDDENFWNTKMKNSEAWKTHEQQMQDEIVKMTARALGIQETDFANFIDTKGGFRQVDYSNANTMAQAENNLQSSLMSQITGYVAQMTNNKAGYRQTDMSNVVQFLNTQGAKEAKTVQELIDLWAKFYNAKKKAIQAEINDYNKRTQELMKSTGAMMEEEAWLEDGALKHGILNATKQLTDLELSNTAMTNYFEGISAWFNGVSGGLGQNYVGGKGVGGGGLSSSRPSTSTTGSGSKPSSGSGSGGSGSGSGYGSEKTVEDMELEIDRYYTLQDAIENVNKALAKNQALQENVTTKAEYKKLIEEEINLTNQKIKALENLRREQERERDELKASLKSNGFAFDGNNNITNYANRLRQLQNWANGITNPDQKEAAIAQVNAIKEMVDKYTELEDSTIPSTTEEINGLKNEIVSINKEFEENMKLIDALGDRYFDVLRKIAKVENELALNQAKQDNANDYERIDLLGKEIELLLKRQQLIKEQREESTKEANELKNQLVGKGVKFDNNGSITNYKALVKSLEDKANGLVGDAQSEAVEDAQEILDLIDKYVTLTEDTLPSLETEWEKYTTQIQGSKDAIDEIFRSFKQTVTDVQKDIASAYEKYQTERYNKLQEALDKEIELYNKAYEEENFNRDLSKQQRELEEIAQQIAIYSRDTTEAGKARLEQLRKEYEEQQQAINDMIRDKEKDNANDRFDEVSESLDKELEDLLSPEKLVATVNDAIANGMITVGEETMKLDDLMTTWLNDTGDGLYALGDILKSELVENLEKAQDIIGKMNVNGFTMKAPTTTNDKLQAEIDKLKNTSVTGDMNFSLVVQGDVTKDSMPKLEKELQNMENRIYANIAKSLK